MGKSRFKTYAEDTVFTEGLLDEDAIGRTYETESGAVFTLLATPVKVAPGLHDVEIADRFGRVATWQIGAFERFGLRSNPTCAACDADARSGEEGGTYDHCSMRALLGHKAAR